MSYLILWYQRIQTNIFIPETSLTQLCVLGITLHMILEPTSLRTCVSNARGYCILANLVFYLVAIRFHIFSINNRKMLLTSVKKIIIQASPGWNNPLALAQNWHWDVRPESYHHLPFLEEELQLFTLPGVIPPRKSKAYFVHTAHIGSLWQGPYCSPWCCRWVDNRTERLADCPSSSYGLVSDCSWPTPWW